MERSQRRWIKCSLLKVLQQITFFCVSPVVLVSPSSTEKYLCHTAEKWKYSVNPIVGISPWPSSMQSALIFIILLLWVFGSILPMLRVVSGDQSEPSPLVTPVQTAGRCAGAGRCPSPCSVLVNIRKYIKCQVHFARKLSNLFGFYLIFAWRMGLGCKYSSSFH